MLEIDFNPWPEAKQIKSILGQANLSSVLLHDNFFVQGLFHGTDKNFADLRDHNTEYFMIRQHSMFLIGWGRHFYTKWRHRKFQILAPTKEIGLPPLARGQSNLHLPLAKGQAMLYPLWMVDDIFSAGWSTKISSKNNTTTILFGLLVDHSRSEPPRQPDFILL